MSQPDLDLPFFEDTHRRMAAELGEWAAANLTDLKAHANNEVDATCRRLVAALGQAGWLGYCVPARYGGQLERLDSRALCLARQTLAYRAGLADFAFAMQGLGSGAITLFGSPALQEEYLPGVGRGELIAAFALSEPGAGSDAAAMTTTARLDGDEYVLNGCKTWISNGGIADFYTVFARSEERPGPKGISAFVVPASTPGLVIAERIEVIAPHPLATLRFEECRIPISNRLGAAGEGFRVAMATLDVFRSSVAAAALGFGYRALDEGLHYALNRPMFGQTLADFQLTQARLADGATELDAAFLLVYRAAWLRDVRGATTTKEAAMAKLSATEAAQRVIDGSVQLFGGLGVRRGQIAESLYREIRALRIYEGATEVQKLVIAKALLKEARA